MKYVVGWVLVKPGTRDAFLQASRPLILASRQEPGIEAFEFHPSAEDADTVVLVERYASEEAHKTHLGTAHFAAFGPVVKEFVVKGRFDNIVSDDVKTHLLGD